MLADAPRVYQSLELIRRPPGRTSPLEKADWPPEDSELADQRPIVRFEPIIPLEIAEFDSDGLADARQWVKPTPTCRP
jgi:hypothetical protein